MPRAANGKRGKLAIAAIVAGGVLLAINAPALFSADGDTAPTDMPRQVVSLADQGSQTIQSMRTRLERVPQDAETWAQLGLAFIEQARITGDTDYYADADEALDRSLREQSEDNGTALIGKAALANARHNFSSALEWGEQAKAVLPDTAEVYGVLADAHTQLGNPDAATAAIQRMLDLEPGVASFTRAAYDFEQHGRVEDARRALERALEAAGRPADVAFSRYLLGELAFASGKLDEAADQFRKGLLVDPRNIPLLEGQAMIDVARGDIDQALTSYQEIVSRSPLPEYRQEYAAVLSLAGRQADAEKQYRLITQRLRELEADGANEALTASEVAADRGREAEALRYARQEWERRQHTSVADALAWALHLNGRDGEALTYADRAAALGERNADYAFHRGMILASLGRTADAIDALERALRINPHFSPVDAPLARETLKTLRSK